VAGTNISANPVSVGRAKDPNRIVQNEPAGLGKL